MEISALIKSLTAPLLSKALDSVGALQKGQIVEVTITQAAREGLSEVYRVELAGKTLDARSDGTWRPEVGERYVMEVTQTGKQPVLQRVLPAQVAASPAGASSLPGATASVPRSSQQTLTLLLSALPSTSSTSSAPPAVSSPASSPPAAAPPPLPLSVPVALLEDDPAQAATFPTGTLTGVVIAIEGSRITVQLDAMSTSPGLPTAPQPDAAAASIDFISRGASAAPSALPLDASVVERSANRLLLHMNASTLLQTLAAHDATFTAVASRPIPTTPLPLDATLVAVRQDGTLQLRWDARALASPLASDATANPGQAWPLVEMAAQQHGETLIITRLRVLSPDAAMTPAASPVSTRINQTAETVSVTQPADIPPLKTAAPAAALVTERAGKWAPEIITRTLAPMHVQVTLLSKPPLPLTVDMPVLLHIGSGEGATRSGSLQFTPQQALDPAQQIQHALLRCLPQQTPLHGLLPQLQHLAAITPQNRVAETLQWLARAMLEQLPSPPQLAQPERLQQTWLHSGTFLESQLAQKTAHSAWQIDQDFKAQLVKLVQALRDATATPIHIDDAAAPLDALRQTAEGVLAKITLNQLASLPSNDAPKQVWLVDLPVWDPQAETPAPRLQIEKETHASTPEHPTDAWSVILTVTPPGLGTLRCKIRLLQQQISVYFFSDRQEITQLIQTHLETLQRQLQDKGLNPGSLAAYQSAPLAEQPSGSTPSRRLFSDRA